ncbi:unnamed protein product [Blepharisma stoltei]|uniref:Helicase ATP-binding domain-containing protein n=1 Tax=Blepharisma stoltei TaxID=1481888 RepID=A0AAU9IIC7_9CILI|nr:unnamed protein product [Blepharisma stoltei]
MADKEEFFRFETNRDVTLIESFEEIQLIDPLRLALNEEGITEPLPILKQCYRAFNDESNLIIFLPPASGKNILISLSILGSINYSDPYPQVIIVEPRIYLIPEMLNTLTHYAKYLQPTFLITSRETKIADDIKKLPESQIIIGTSKRINSMIKSRKKFFSHVGLLIIDAGGGIYEKKTTEDSKESEEWKDQGETLHEIIKKLGRNVRKRWVSGNMHEDFFIKRVSEYTPDPLIIKSCFQVAVAGGQIHYKIECTDEDDKLEKLKHLMSQNPDTQKIIFCKFQNLERLTQEIKQGFERVLEIMNLIARDQLHEAYSNFKEKQYMACICQSKGYLIRQLYTTQQVEIYNYDMGKSKKKYLKRIRRNGLYKQGDKIFNFLITDEEKQKLARIEEKYGYIMQNSSFN